MYPASGPTISSASIVNGFSPRESGPFWADAHASYTRRTAGTSAAVARRARTPPAGAGTVASAAIGIRTSSNAPTTS